MIISLCFVITNMLTCFFIKSDTQNRWQNGPIMIKFVFSRRFIILCFLSANMKLPIMEAVWRRSFSVIALGGWIWSLVLIVRQTGRILLFFIFGAFNKIFPFHSANHGMTIMKNMYQKAHLKFGPFFFRIRQHIEMDWKMDNALIVLVIIAWAEESMELYSTTLPSVLFRYMIYRLSRI